ncbi:MAG: hypothetical protein QOE71_2613 [Pseudonocardiales bacterium]|nr:hypothetical protein [Pseudonocardiales bacterium]
MSRYREQPQQPQQALVGRQTELTALALFPDSIVGGACGLVLLGGAGLGKTALWLHGLREAARTARVLTCRPGQFGTKLSYSGLAELLDGLDAEIASLPEMERHALRQATRNEEIPGTVADHATVTDHATVALAAAGALRNAATQPLVLAIDDLQWLDSSSARVIGFAVRRLSDRAIGVLAAQRGSAPSELLTAGLPRDRISVLELGPLTETETDQLIRVRLGAALLRPLVGQVHRASGGNPLFSLELALAVLQEPKPLATGAPLPLPNSLRVLMGRRIAALGAPTRDVLLLVAAAADATVAIVEAALGHAALAALQRAIDAGLLETERGHLRFTHPLLSATTYAAADPARRRRLHLLLASLAVDVEERARQLSAATELPDAGVAAQVTAGAAAAYARGAPDAAGALAERALALTPERDRAPAFRRAVTASDYLWDAGDISRCVALLHRLMDQLPPGGERATVLRRLATATAVRDSWMAAAPILAQGIAEAGDDVTLLAALHRDLAFVVMQSGDVRSSTHDATVAMAFAERSDDEEVCADAETNFLLQAVIGNAAPADLRARLERLQALPDSRDRWIPSGSRLVLLAAMLKWIDDFDASRALLRTVYIYRWNRQEDGLLMPALFQLGELECWAGRLDEAAELADLARATERRSPRENERPMFLYPLALAAARAGDGDRARELAHESLSIVERTGDGRHQMRALAVLGFIDLSTGDIESAITHLDRVDTLQRELGYRHPGVIRAAADHIEALIAIGELTRAEQRLAVLHSQAEESRSHWATLAALRCRGLIEAATGDLQAAETVLRRSVAASAHVPDPLERGRTLLALGSILRRQRRRSDAREVLDQALGEFGSMHAELWSTKAAAELDRLSGRGRSAAGLTPMETRIAELVAAGRSNKEVAAEIYLSRKTVEAHLSSIYRKLELRSRTELAAHLLSGGPSGRAGPAGPAG